MSILYFAYGSNLYTPRLRFRVPDCRHLGIATLRRHQLRFHKRSIDGSAKCDAFQTIFDDDFVLGALFEIPESQKGALDRAEGLGGGYLEKSVTVEGTGGVTEAVTYVADQSAITTSLQPYGWYRDFVLRGAAEHRLPLDYVRRFIEVPWFNDPDQSRDREKRREVRW